MSGDNLNARDRLERGESPLAIAIQPLQTSKYTKGHSGYGLYLASELAVRNAGSFRLTSGDQSLSRYPRYGGEPSNIDRHAPWQGTIVSLIFDLNQTIPYEEVYLTLPVEPGYEPEDYFV